jgi:hypothetical protein
VPLEELDDLRIALDFVLILEDVVPLVLEDDIVYLFALSAQLVH